MPACPFGNRAIIRNKTTASTDQSDAKTKSAKQVTRVRSDDIRRQMSLPLNLKVDPSFRWPVRWSCRPQVERQALPVAARHALWRFEALAISRIFGELSFAGSGWPLRAFGHAGCNVFMELARPKPQIRKTKTPIDSSSCCPFLCFQRCSGVARLLDVCCLLVMMGKPLLGVGHGSVLKITAPQGHPA